MGIVVNPQVLYTHPRAVFCMKYKCEKHPDFQPGNQKADLLDKPVFWTKKKKQANSNSVISFSSLSNKRGDGDCFLRSCVHTCLHATKMVSTCAQQYSSIFLLSSSSYLLIDASFIFLRQKKERGEKKLRFLSHLDDRLADEVRVHGSANQELAEEKRPSRCKRQNFVLK